MLRQLAVPIAVVGMLVSLIIPLPPMAVDLMLVANLLLALLLLISALYLNDPIKLSALPTILLLATLYRLSLNVSSTRLILSEGDAGEVIQAFGSAVIQGNLVVGVVIFLIITLVQFLVIAKGAERVAEVSARFTLDALPGKQLSIDADVRAGLINFEQARQKRQDLQAESRFYGALDGAMKFVKGDAIAGLVIVCINILGGLAIGILANGMDVADAVARYTLLTVGDGLVSQLPALLNSLAAGIVVTRVVSSEKSSLADDIFSQLWQVKKVKVIVASLALVLAFIPAMPLLPFLSLALVLFVSAALGGGNTSEASASVDVSAVFQPKLPPVLELKLGKGLATELRDGGKLAATVTAMQRGVYQALGLILLPPDVSLLGENERGLQICMRGIVVKNEVFEEGKQNLGSLISELLQQVVTERAVEFVDDIHTRRVLDFFDSTAPELVSNVIPGVISVTQLSEILRNPIGEGISIRNFDLILQAVAEHGAKPQGERALYEEVRIALRRMISERYAKGGSIRAYVLDAALDLALIKAERESAFVDPDYFLKIEEWIRGQDYDGVVLLASKGARRLLQEGLRLRDMQITVLAHEEIAEGTALEIIGRIELQESKRREIVEERLAC
ncbi:MAG: FHIPEP family type III secretion protein [Deltaproteobacteria bacterium]|nr:FHIPEP family type III secretion protein [Deltaproteobacteria bacterium]